MSDRFRRAAKGFWNKVEQQRWVVGTLGRLNSDGETFTFEVKGRPNFVYVTVRQASGAQTVVPARNDAGVPHQPYLGVKMRLEYGVYVIESRTGSGTVALPQPTPEHGLIKHASSHKHGGSDEVGSSVPGAYLIPKAEGDGKLAAGWFDYSDIESAVQDTIIALLEAGANISLNYNDLTDKLEIAVSELTESVQDIVANTLEQGDNVEITYNDTTGTITISATGGGGGGSSGLMYRFDSETNISATPAGYMRFPTPLEFIEFATAIGIAFEDQNGSDLGDYLKTWSDSTSTVKGTLLITKRSDPSTFLIFNVTGESGSPTTPLILFIAYVTSSGTLTDEDEVTLDFTRAGDAGDAADIVAEIDSATELDPPDDGWRIAGTLSSALRWVRPQSGIIVL